MKFPRETNLQIAHHFIKHSRGKGRREFIAPLCKENDKVFVGQNVLLGTTEQPGKMGIFYIDGHLTKDCCERGEQIGLIHSHPTHQQASYREFDYGYSEDDIHGLAKEVLTGYYSHYPIINCVIVPVKETELGFILDVQCERYQKFTEDDIKKMKKNAPNDIMSVPPDYPWNEHFNDTDIKYILEGYPVFIHPEDAMKKMKDGTITKKELVHTLHDQLFFNTDYASIKKGLKEQGKLDYDHFFIGCKKMKLGRRDHVICDTKEEHLFE
jgi:hypothetical protein